MALNLAWYDWVGIAGTLMVLAAFFLLQAGRVSGTGIVYQLLNPFGAGGVLLSLLGTFNVSVFLLEFTWVLISGYGIVRSFRSRRVAPTRIPRCTTRNGRRRCSARSPTRGPRRPPLHCRRMQRLSRWTRATRFERAHDAVPADQHPGELEQEHRHVERAQQR